MKPESKLLIMFVLLVLTACSGCKEKYKITGLGGQKLGDENYGDYCWSTSFMFFSDVGIRVTPMSHKVYSVYYRKSYSANSYNYYVSDRNMRHVANINKNLDELILALKKKYADCCPPDFVFREPPTKEFITRLTKWVGYNNSWKRVFEVSDKNRHVGVFISDDEDALTYGQKTSRHFEEKILGPIEIVVVAWDDDLLYQSDRECEKIISEGL